MTTSPECLAKRTVALRPELDLRTCSASVSRSFGGRPPVHVTIDRSLAHRLTLRSPVYLTTVSRERRRS